MTSAQPRGGSMEQKGIAARQARADPSSAVSSAQRKRVGEIFEKPNVVPASLRERHHTQSTSFDSGVSASFSLTRN